MIGALLALTLSFDLRHSFGQPWGGYPTGLYEIGHALTPNRAGAMFVYGESIKRVWTMGSAWVLTVSVGGRGDVMAQEHIDFDCSHDSVTERSIVMFSPTGAPIYHRELKPPERHITSPVSIEGQAIRHICSGVKSEALLKSNSTPQEVVKQVRTSWLAWKAHQ